MKRGATPEVKDDLDPVVYHVQAALQAIRDIPCKDLETEEFYTWIYQLLGAASRLMTEDAYQKHKVPKPDEGQLLDDLAAVKTERWVWKPKALQSEDEEER